MTEPTDQNPVEESDNLTAAPQTETVDAQDTASSVPGTEGTTPGSGVEMESVASADNLFPDLADNGMPDTGNRDMTMLMDIPVQLTVELGRKRVPIKHVLQMAKGSVIELNNASGEPMDVLVNGCLIAQGEVVVVNDRFGVRLTEIVTPAERIRRLNRG